jgi:hypothetical protein
VLKTGLKWIFFLNRGGLRVDSQETQGLFNKTARAKGYLRISAVGSGSTARIRDEAEPVRVDPTPWITI